MVGSGACLLIVATLLKCKTDWKNMHVFNFVNKEINAILCLQNLENFGQSTTFTKTFPSEKQCLSNVSSHKACQYFYQNIKMKKQTTGF